MENIKGIEFLKNRIKERLNSVANQMGKYQYKLAMAVVENCNSLEELKNMAELSLQMEFFEYIKDEINPLLDEMNMTIADVRKMDINDTPKNNDANDNFELDPSEISEAMDDEETTQLMAMMLMNRIKTEDIEEKYRQEILDFQLEEKPDPSSIDSIELDDEDFGTLEDSEEQEEQEDDSEGFSLDDLDEPSEQDMDELDGFYSESDNDVDSIEIDEEDNFSDIDDIEIDGEDDFNGIDDIEIDEEANFNDVDDIEIDEDADIDNTDDIDEGTDNIDDINTDDLEVGDVFMEESDESYDGSDNIDDINTDDLELGTEEDDDDFDGIENSEPDIEFEESSLDDLDAFGELNDINADQSSNSNNSDDDFDIDEDDFGDIGESYDNVGVLDDTDNFFSNSDSQNKQTNKPKNVLIHNSPSRSSGITPTTVFKNGTVQGDKTQMFFNMIHKLNRQSVKLASKVKEQTTKAINSKFFEIGSESDFEIDL